MLLRGLLQRKRIKLLKVHQSLYSKSGRYTCKNHAIIDTIHGKESYQFSHYQWIRADTQIITRCHSPNLPWMDEAVVTMVMMGFPPAPVLRI